jgi:O-antigen/teichoic acid export membrane protein
VSINVAHHAGGVEQLWRTCFLQEKPKHSKCVTRAPAGFHHDPWAAGPLRQGSYLALKLTRNSLISGGRDQPPAGNQKACKGRLRNMNPYSYSGLHATEESISNVKPATGAVEEMPIHKRGSNEWVLAQLGTITRAILPSRLRSSAYAIDSMPGRIAVGAFWSLVGTGTWQVLAFLTTISSARLLGVQRYGELSVISSTINLFSVLAIAGLGMTATKHVAEYRQSDPPRAGRILGLSSVIASGSGLVVVIGLLLLAPTLSEKVLKSQDLTLNLRLGAITLFFAALNGAQTGALAGFEAFRELAIANALKGVLTVSIVCVLTLKLGVTGAVLGYAVTSCATYFIYRGFITTQCRRYKVPTSHDSWRSELPLLWTFSLPVVIATLPFAPATWWCNTLLATKAGYSQAGVYMAASQYQQVMLFFSSGISSIALPLLSHAVPEKNLSKYKRLLALNTLVTAAFVFAVACLLVLFAPQLMKLYGRDFERGIPVLRLICLSTVIGTVNSAVPHAIWSLNATRAGMLLSLLRCVVLIAATYALVYRGAVGLAAAYLVVAVIQTSTECVFLWRLLDKCRLRWSAPKVPI